MDIKAFPGTDFKEDLKAVDVPNLVLQGDDHIVSSQAARVLSAKLLKHGTLKIYPGFPAPLAVRTLKLAILSCSRSCVAN
jgi:non-heme chloroperoxidase